MRWRGGGERLLPLEVFTTRGKPFHPTTPAPARSPAVTEIVSCSVHFVWRCPERPFGRGPRTPAWWPGRRRLENPLPSRSGHPARNKTGTPPRRMADSGYLRDHDYGNTRSVLPTLEASMLENPAPPPKTSPATPTPPAAKTTIPCRAHPKRITIRAAHRRRASTGVPAGSPELDWLRQSLRACDLLASVQSISPSDRALVAFGIEWAPYGGADSEELFIKFGVQRNRFLVLLQAAMAPRPSDLERLRILKTTLCNDLLRAWNESPPRPPSLTSSR